MADWFCWHVGTTGDPKFTAVARKANVPKVLAIALWAWLLERAKAADQPGTFGKFDHEDAAITLEIETAQVTATLSAFKDKGMISETKIINWDKRQHNTSSKERTRAWRERKKQAETLPSVTERHSDNGDVTERRVTAQDRTGQDITLQNKTSSGGANGHANGHKNGTVSKLDLNPLRASRVRQTGFSRIDKQEAWAAKMFRFLRAHGSAADAGEFWEWWNSGDEEKRELARQVFNTAERELDQRTKAGTLVDGWNDA